MVVKFLTRNFMFSMVVAEIVCYSPQPLRNMSFTRRNHSEISIIIHETVHQFLVQIIIVLSLLLNMTSRKRKRLEHVPKYSMIKKMPIQLKHLNRMIGESDADCIFNLRMDRNCFGRLCRLLRELGSLTDGKYVSVEEQVAMFLSILAHHKKNSIVRFNFWRSGQTVSYYLHVVLKAILRLNSILLVKPEPLPEHCVDGRWKWFKVLIMHFLE